MVVLMHHNIHTMHKYVNGGMRLLA
jgi:hypothetical protein